MTTERDFAPHEYTDAKVHSVFLNMYNWATGRIKNDITGGQADLASTESIYSQDNPSVIKEYLAANDDDKQLFELTFKTFKTHMQLKAREKWYDWKFGVMENIRPSVEEVYVEVKQVSTLVVCARGKVGRVTDTGVLRTSNGWTR